MKLKLIKCLQISVENSKDREVKNIFIFSQILSLRISKTLKFTIELKYENCLLQIP